MKKLILSFFFICTSILSFGQLLPIQYDTLEIDNEIILNGFGDYSANSIEQDITSKFIYKGGFIDDEMKQRSFDKHRNINRIGTDISISGEYKAYKIRPFKKKDWGMVFNAGYHVFGGMLYSKDVFGLAMYGNAMYVGDTIEMSGLDIQITMFQKIGFGLIDPKTKSSVSLNFYNINNRIRGNFRDLSLEQSSDGSSVILNMGGSIEMAKDSSFNQGLGVGFDADFKFPISWKADEVAFIQFKAQNVGVGFMTHDQQRYEADTSFHYSGFEFDQIMGDNSILNDSISILDTLGIESSTSKPVFILPGFLQVSKIVDSQSDKKIQSFYGMRVYPTLIYSPFIFAGIDYHPASWVRVGLQGAIGGFSGLKLGAYSSFNFSNCSIGLGSENLIGFFSKKGNGRSVVMRFRCAF